jgi:hypothetical protein
VLESNFFFANSAAMCLTRMDFPVPDGPITRNSQEDCGRELIKLLILEKKKEKREKEKNDDWSTGIELPSVLRKEK